MEKERWIEAFNPEREDDDIYQAWDCPEFQVVTAWEPSAEQRGDSMPLRKGDIIVVEKKGNEWMKGVSLCRVLRARVCVLE